MTEDLWMALAAFAFLCGLWLGKTLEAWTWRLKGNHDYMNRKESGGRLYHVRRETK